MSKKGNETLLQVRVDKRSKQELIPERLQAYASKSGRSINALALEAIRNYLDSVDGKDPLRAMINSNVAQAILNDRERITRNAQFVSAITSCLGEEMEKAIMTKVMRLVHSQEVNDKRLAGWEEAEKHGEVTPLSVAAQNVKAMQESAKSREHPLEN